MEIKLGNIVFVGPGASGKTTALCLLHFTAIDHGEELGISSYMPRILSPDYDFFSDADSLVLHGEDVQPTPPDKKDLKVELRLGFEGWFGKQVTLVFSDMAGPISAALMNVFPELPGLTPDKIIEELNKYGIKVEDARYLIKNILEADGMILIADASKIGKRGESVDAQISNYLNNLINYIERRKRTPKGIALLLTKFDKWFYLYGDLPSRNEIIHFVKDKLPTVWKIIDSLNVSKGINYDIFYSGLIEEEKDEKKNGRFVLELDTKGRRRIKYNIEQYKKLLLWIKGTF